MQITSFSLPKVTHQVDGRFGVVTNEQDNLEAGFHTKSGDAAPIVHGNRKTPNPHWFWYQEDRHLEGFYRLDEPGGWFTVKTGWVNSQYDYVPRAWHDPAASVPSPYNKALEKLYGKIRSDVDLSIDIYQGGQTVKMIKDFSKLIVSPINTFARGMQALVRDRKISRSSSFISNKWLEWQYGIKPTMSTIHSLTSDLVEQLVHPDGFLQAKARASNKNAGVFLDPSVSQVSGAQIPLKVQFDLQHRVEIAILYGISNAEANALSQFTSLNPASFIYENIPFSFVLDWAIDIGGYLRMMETALMTGLEFKSGYVTNTIKHDFTATRKGAATNQYGFTYTVDGQSSSKYRYFNRSLLGSMPLPEVPRLDVNLGSSRLMSAASLLRGFIKH